MIELIAIESLDFDCRFASKYFPFMQRLNTIFWLVFVKNQPKKTYIKSQLISKGNEKIDFLLVCFH